MQAGVATDDGITTRLARRLRALRHERGWSLDELAARSGVSRAALSRMENAAVSPTTEALGRLCSAYSLTLSRLIAQAEDDVAAHVPVVDQPCWRDDAAGFVRRSVSPPSRSLAAEVLHCELAAGARLTYDAPSVVGLEHHLVMLDGALEVQLEERVHRLAPGDCLRYQLSGASAFTNPASRPVRYLLVLVGA